MADPIEAGSPSIPTKLSRAELVQEALLAICQALKAATNSSNEGNSISYVSHDGDDDEGSLIFKLSNSSGELLGVFGLDEGDLRVLSYADENLDEEA